MTGGYLETSIRTSHVRPLIAFREYVFRDVLRAFDNLSERANQLANDYFQQVNSQPCGEYEEMDLGGVADTANERDVGWYQMMTSIHQSMMNLVAAGLFHLLEQQLGALSRDASFSAFPLKETKLDKIVRWYQGVLGLDLASLPSWATIDELRLVANAVKHAEGSAARSLRVSRPELFFDPALEVQRLELIAFGIESQPGPISAPLSGEDFFVTEALLKTYAEASESFLNEIADYFREHGDTRYPLARLPA